MAKYFTSIFHEEVIPVNETKSEIKYHYADRIARERHAGRHDLSKPIKDNNKKFGSEIRDKGDYASVSKPMKSRKDYRERESRAKDNLNRADHSIEYRKEERKKAKNESFLLDIELD